MSGAAEQVNSKVRELIDDERERMLRFVQRLVKVPSVSGTPDEGRAQKIVIGELKRIGRLSLDVWTPKREDIERYPLHPVRNRPWGYQGRPNVVAILRGSGGGRSLLLNGHIDVVSPEPIGGWREDPWGGRVSGNKLYGRGSMDMKGGMAAMVFAIEALVRSRVSLRGDLIFESVVEEEYGGGGTAAAVVRGYRADAAIIAESTSSDSICIASGGSRFFKVRITGKPEWPHLAHHGVNAIELASRVYHELIRLDRERVKRLRGRHPLLETLRAGGGRGPGRPANMTVGILRAGDWPATVAGWAEIEGRIGIAPSERGEEVEREVEERLERLAANDPWLRDHPPTVEWWGARREGFELGREEEIVKTMKSNVEAVRGRCDLYGTSSASDASYLAPRIGEYGGIPTVLYGPGGEGAHTYDEHVLTDEIADVAKALAGTILDWCGWEGR